MMFRTLRQLVLVKLFVASIICVVGTSRCPFAVSNSSRCRCNRILMEIICTDLDAVPDFSSTADDDYRSLYIQRGRIDGMGPSAFAGLPLLVKIVVDFNPLDVDGLHQATFQLDRKIDESASSLRELSIGASRVWSLPPELLYDLRQLKRLSLWGNEFDRIPAGFFSAVANSLIELSLWGNRLERIDDTTFDVGAYQQWSLLRTLDLDRNLISWVGSHSFHTMPNIETLRLAGNRVSALSADALTGLDRLRSLRLEHNGLGFIHTSAFVSLDSLLSLSLGDNALAFLPDGLFEPLARLIDLRLQNNRLEYVWWRTFRGLRSLRRIDLSGNRLSNLPDDVFRHSTRLSVLSLDDNHLRTLRRCSLPPVDDVLPLVTPPPPQSAAVDRSTWSRSRRRRTLSLLGNISLRCDCRLAWLADQVDDGVTTVWGSCDVALDRPPSSSVPDMSYDGRCPILSIVLRHRFDVCPAHTRQQNNCKT